MDERDSKEPCGGKDAHERRTTVGVNHANAILSEPPAEAPSQSKIAADAARLADGHTGRLRNTRRSQAVHEHAVAARSEPASEALYNPLRPPTAQTFNEQRDVHRLVAGTRRRFSTG